MLQDFSERAPSTESFRPVPLRSGEPRSELDPVLSLLGAMDILSECRDLDSMLRQAVELGRERLGLERVRIYMRERSPGERIVVSTVRPPTSITSITSSLARSTTLCCRPGCLGSSGCITRTHLGSPPSRGRTRS